MPVLISNTALQYLPPLLLNVCKDGNQDEIVIPALRQLACVLLLSRFHIHTQTTLQMLEEHVQQFGRLTSVNMLLFILNCSNALAGDAGTLQLRSSSPVFVAEDALVDAPH